MAKAPHFSIDLHQFLDDPYPALAKMRAAGGIHFVPEFDAILFTYRDDISVCEKNIEVFSSRQPGGLMDKLMGQNMMRKDGVDHQEERRKTFPALSPRTARDQWLPKFRDSARDILDELHPKGEADLVKDFAMLLSGEALKVVTGLTNMKAAELDRVSQGMIDGIANYSGDPTTESNCNDCTASIDRHIDEIMPELAANPDKSLLSVQMQAGMSDYSTRANVKLAISGGQNEPRDAISGAIWALLTYPEQRQLVASGQRTWLDVFEEYVRWMSPIGMSPRRVDKAFTYRDVDLTPNERVFFMFSSANRDEQHFDHPNQFDVTRDTRPAMAFGAGPHFCAGAAISRSLIAEVALPMVFERLPNLRFQNKAEASFQGWAFRGLTSLPCAWDI